MTAATYHTDVGRALFFLEELEVYQKVRTLPPRTIGRPYRRDY